MGPHDGMEATARETTGSEGTLNVILHGLFTVVQGNMDITAYIPHMGSEHLYRAGNWLAETTLAEHAVLGLRGVDHKIDHGRDELNPKQNIILSGEVNVSGHGHENHSVYATLTFPYPRSITSLRRLTIDKREGIGGDSEDRIEGFADPNPYQSSTVQVLTYHFTNDTALRLGNHPWEPVLQNGYVNLHVFSEPERSPTDDHIRHAFRESTGLFVGVDLTLTRLPSPPSQDTARDIPPGVDPLELEDLVARQRWLAVLGRAIKDGRDVNSIWYDPVPFGSANSCSGSAVGRCC